jgi:hypothetical protein
MNTDWSNRTEAVLKQLNEHRDSGALVDTKAVAELLEDAIRFRNALEVIVKTNRFLHEQQPELWWHVGQWSRHPISPESCAPCAALAALDPSVI